MTKHELPRKTNNHAVPNDYRLRGITNSMDWKEQEEIETKNNQEYTKQQYEKMGIKVIEEYDDLMFSVELPEGWETKSDGGYWVNVTDDKGRERISYFYKGCPWDRDAFSNFNHRYSYTVLPFDEYKDSNVTLEDRRFKPWRVYITDSGDKIKMIKEVVATTKEEYFRHHDELKEIGKRYLDEHYPDWQNINAYWEENIKEVDLDETIEEK